MDFLEELDKELERKITVVAVGGTAMTLHNTKASTIDVDFTIPVILLHSLLCVREPKSVESRSRKFKKISQRTQR